MKKTACMLQDSAIKRAGGGNKSGESKMLSLLVKGQMEQRKEQGGIWVDDYSQWRRKVGCEDIWWPRSFTVI